MLLVSQRLCACIFRSFVWREVYVTVIRALSSPMLNRDPFATLILNKYQNIKITKISKYQHKKTEIVKHAYSDHSSGVREVYTTVIVNIIIMALNSKFPPIIIILILRVGGT